MNTPGNQAARQLYNSRRDIAKAVQGEHKVGGKVR
jgi:hypothetical protein